MNIVSHPIITGSKILNIPVTTQQAELMEMYAKQLLAWNKKINLTAITDPLQVAEKHFIDSIAACPSVENLNRVLDMGSGGGFPGIVLKIMNPDLELVLVDAVRKKINFLKHVIRQLGLEHIQAIHARVENLQTDPDHRAGYDAVISRAFADLSKFSSLALPFLKKNGFLLAMKGKHGNDEITSEISKTFKLTPAFYQLPFEHAHRSIIRMTPKR